MVHKYKDGNCNVNARIACIGGIVKVMQLPLKQFCRAVRRPVAIGGK